jgi:hypothetical protein
METAGEIFGRFLRLLAGNVLFLYPSISSSGIRSIFPILYVLQVAVSESHVHDEHG